MPRRAALSIGIVAFTLAAALPANASSIDRELLRQVLSSAHPAIARCGLAPDRYVVRLTIEGDGAVSRVLVSEPFDLAPADAQCVARAFEALVFPTFGRPPAPPTTRPGEPRSHLPHATRRVERILVTWPFVIRGE
ncbi:MAG: hypothetical protein KF901_02470 [Myxococcales bacterium]|nr:hypothetical protein [Myxococcales bacterium]